MQSSAPLIHDLTATLLEHHEPRHSLMLQCGGLRIALRSNSGMLVEHLADYYRAFSTPPADSPDLEILALEATPPGIEAEFRSQPRPQPSQRLKEEYADLADGRVVRKVRTGMMFLCGPRVDVAVGPCTAYANQVINFINSRYLQRLLVEGSLLLHAAAVAEGRAGLALTGFAGAGKSTLALHLLGRGHAFVSNDRVVVQRGKEGLVISGIPKQPRVNPGTLLNNPRLQGLLTDERRRELAEMSPQALWELEDKYDVDVQRCFGLPPQQLQAGMVGVVVLNWQRDGGTTRAARVDLAQCRDLLPAIWKLPGVFIEGSSRETGQQPAAEPYIQMLSACPVHEITGGIDFPTAVACCEDLLANRSG